jgi:hypothetical protein
MQPRLGRDVEPYRRLIDGVSLFDPGHGGCMRTTLDLPDDLFRQVKARAALEGASLKELLTRYIEFGLRQAHSNGGQRPQRSPLPIIRKPA